MTGARWLRERDHGRYAELLSWAVAQKMRKGMTPTEAERAYGFERHTVVEMKRRADDER